MNAERAAARWRVRRVWRLSLAGMEHLQRARLATAARAATETSRVRFDGHRPTVAELRVLAAALAAVAAPPSDPSAPTVRFAGRGLTVVNALMLAVVLGHLLDRDGARPGLLLVAGLLATCGATAQAVLAVDVGRRLRPLAGLRGLRPLAGLRAPPEPPLSAVLGAGLLAVTGGLACFAAYAWAQTVGSGNLAVGAGLLLGASALAAPFMLVADEVHGPGPHRRLLGRIERRLDGRNRRCRRLERRAVRHLAAAGRRLWRAEEALAATVDLLGADHPLADALTAAVQRLRDALTGQGFAGTRPPRDPEDLDPEDLDGLDPDDLDLAG